MLIKEIEISDFRIYQGRNVINLLPDDPKNIIVISGKNGYGKTTFLMALVWCLYGRQMQLVDDLYKKEIEESGGYGKYISNSLNRLSRYNGETEFSVGITFVDIDIPEIPCEELRIIRSFNVETSTGDRVEIYIDGQRNELIDDAKPDAFIQDFILPKEIAKFFLFDAEKIVSLAEETTDTHRKYLSRAYSQVLGIQKYEDLKQSLIQAQRRLREEFASPSEKADLAQLKADVEKLTVEIQDKQSKIEECRELIVENRQEASQLQAALIRAGSQITVEELNQMRQEEVSMEVKLEEIKGSLRDLYEEVPFAIAGRQLVSVSRQLDREAEQREALHRFSGVEDKANQILDDLNKAREKLDFPIEYRTQEFYNNTLKKLIKSHFFSEVPEVATDFEKRHEFSDTERRELQSLLNNLNTSFKEAFRRLTGDYNQTRNELHALQRRIRAAEGNQEDPTVAEYRTRRDRLEATITDLEQTISELEREIGRAEMELEQKETKVANLQDKIEVSDQVKAKDELTKRLINNLNTFIQEFKQQKKASLEESILEGLTTLMHKKDFIHRVEVDIIGEDIEILLYNSREEQIRKGSLSKGEQQLYATALLKGMVEESETEFPVFIDSPMQKFDEDHAANIVRFFYPSVAEQVTIFPLINKEMTKGEYDMLQRFVSKAFLIDNYSEDQSRFKEVAPNQLFEAVK